MSLNKCECEKCDINNLQIIRQGIYLCDFCERNCFKYKCNHQQVYLLCKKTHKERPECLNYLNKKKDQLEFLINELKQEFNLNFKIIKDKKVFPCVICKDYNCELKEHKKFRYKYKEYNNWNFTISMEKFLKEKKLIIKKIKNIEERKNDNIYHLL